MTHLLVTNDFPPKVGGIQSYLWELWRRLAPERFAVLTTPHEGAAAFDSRQPFRVERVKARVLLPRPALIEAIDRLADEVGADLVLLDPALPLGMVGPRLERPYGLVVHGAEVTVPGRLPGGREMLGRVLRGARVVVAAGRYPAAEAERAAGTPLPTVVVPPGVDVDRFSPLDAVGRAAARERLGLPAHGHVVTSVGRLVPRKGIDTLVAATADLVDATVVIAGGGRDRKRLEDRARSLGVERQVRLLGRVSDADLPSVYGCADVFAQPCRNRWAGLEQEGFGIVFLEAAACGVPQLAGDSGGAAEAVVDGRTGVVVARPGDARAVAGALAALLADDEARIRMGEASRKRAEREYSYDVLAARLDAALSGLG